MTKNERCTNAGKQVCNHQSDTTSELRQQIMYELDNMDSANKTETLDAIEALLAAQKQRWEAEARKDELLKLTGNRDQGPEYFINRIAALDGVIGQPTGQSDTERKTT